MGVDKRNLDTYTFCPKKNCKIPFYALFGQFQYFRAKWSHTLNVSTHGKFLLLCGKLSLVFGHCIPKPQYFVSLNCAVPPPPLRRPCTAWCGAPSCGTPAASPRNQASLQKRKQKEDRAMSPWRWRTSPSGSSCRGWRRDSTTCCSR